MWLRRGISMKYRINEELQPLTEKEPVLKEDVILEIMTVEEYEKAGLVLPYRNVLNHGLDGIRFCKAEVFDRCMVGTLKIPLKPDVVTNFVSLAFYLKEHYLLFISEDSCLKEIMIAVRKMSALNDGSLGTFFYEFLQYFINDDVSYLVRYEDRLFEIEDEILSSKGKSSGLVKEFQQIRKNVLRMGTYYQQLVDMLAIFVENENGIFQEEECHRLQIMMERCDRLYDLTMTIREYCMQLHDLSEAQIQNRQNNNMATLTVITAICMPLTLIAGWYGMNFAYMPELQFHYGYIAVIVISALIVTAEIVILKKKHFLDT